MLTAVDPSVVAAPQEDTPVSLTKELLKNDLPSDDEADVDYEELVEQVVEETEGDEEVAEEEDELDEEEDDDIDAQEVNDIVMGSMAIQSSKVLRGGKELSGTYREATIMQEFASDEEDEEYQQLESEEEDELESEDEEDDEDMEQDISPEEAKDTFLNTAEVMGEKDTLLLNSSKVLRDGKVVSNGEEMTDLTDKIKTMMQESEMGDSVM